MELMYLYIGGRGKSSNYLDESIIDKPYKTLKDIELNFSSEFDFELDLKNKLFTLKNKKDCFNGFFDTEKKISNITALVGKNGTGKSSIIEFIKSIKKDNISNIPYKFIAVFRSKLFKSGKIIKESFRIYHHENLIFKVEKDPGVRLHHFEGLFDDTIKYSTNDYDWLEDSFNFSDTIYYSGIFEPVFSAKESFMIHSNQNSIDISTTGLIEQDAEKYGNINPKGLGFEGVIRRHQLVDIERSLDFIYSEKSKKYLDFKLPEYLKVSINSSDEALVKLSHKNAYDSLISAFDYQFPKAGNSKSKFIYYLNRAIVFNLIRYYTTTDKPLKININRNLDHVLKKDLSTESLFRFIDSINTDVLEGLKEAKALPDNAVSTQLRFYIDFIKSINSFDENLFIFHNSEVCFLLIEQNSTDVVNLFNHYKMAFLLSGVLNFDWQFNKYSNGQLSSGEKSILSFYGRLFSIRQNDFLHSRTPNSYLLLIDEGEQMLHPEWQRTYLNNLINLCLNIFDYVPVIQIILTTHSPFIASDLPPKSVLKIYKDKKTRLSKIYPLTKIESSFAANIHDLFTDKFYLDNGLIGEFAKNKILKLSKRIIRSKEISPKKMELFINEIEIIGEPYIKFRLISVLKSKCNKNQMFLDRISDIEQNMIKNNKKKFRAKNK